MSEPVLQPLTVGLIINPLAGIGGAVGLKGSDGEETVEQALAMGAKPRAVERTRSALEQLLAVKDRLVFLTWSGAMGEQLLERMGFHYCVCGFSGQGRTSAEDTCAAARAIVAQGVDLLIFAGGDGTARDICDAIPETQPVLGIPAGVKIHSGVYAVTPAAAGQVVEKLITGELVDMHSREVRDIDEQAFRQGQVRARYYGELRVPEAGQFVQNVKQGGQEVEALVLQDIADELSETLDDNCLVIAGPGSTIHGVMTCLGHNSTLLGVDLFLGDQCLKQDVREQDVITALQQHQGPVSILVTAIGGQGHILGRGNQQLSTAVVEQVLDRAGREGLLVIATKTKLKQLNGQPLLVDSGNTALNRRLAGTVRIITGYHDAVLYKVVTV